MADPQFEEFRVVFDKMPQYIKAPADCYRLALDLESPMVDESDTKEKRFPALNLPDLTNMDSDNFRVKYPWSSASTPEYGESAVAKRKRRRLPEIPAHKKPLERIVNQVSGGSCIADELREAEKDSENKSCLVRQVSQTMFLEIDTSGSSPKPCLRYYTVNSNDSSLEDFKEKWTGDIDSGTSTAHSPDCLKSLSPTNACLSRSSSTLSSTPSGSRLQLQDATHRGLYKFVPRHTDELAIEIGDPVYVQKEGDDLWCDGVNLRSGLSGIFPSAYAMDVEYTEFEPTDPAKVKKERYLLDFLGSVEVSFHKGNDVLCQAVRKVARACAKEVGVHGPHACILEINDQGLRMVDHKRPLPNHVPMHDYFFHLKNITFCGYHPHDHRYFGFITKHPLHQRFACHIFMGEASARDIAEAVGRAFHRFYYKYIEKAYPVEDIYIE